MESLIMDNYKATFITVSAPAVKLLREQTANINKICNNVLITKIYYATCEFDEATTMSMKEDIISSDVVFLDLMGTPPTVYEAVAQACSKCKNNIIPFGGFGREFLKLGDFSASSMKKIHSGKKPSMKAMLKMQKLAGAVGPLLHGKMQDMNNYGKIMQYFQNADEYNIYNLLNLLLTDYAKIKGLNKSQEPKVALPIALYDMYDKTAFQSTGEFENFMQFDNSLPNVAILFTSHNYPTDSTLCIRALCESLGEFSNVYPIGINEDFVDVGNKIRYYLTNVTNGINFIINCKPFRLSAGPMGGKVEQGIELLREMGVLFAHPFFLTRSSQEDWKKSTKGCSSNELLISIIMSEMDGAIDMIPIGAMMDLPHEKVLGSNIQQLAPIQERIDRFCGRVKNHLILQEKSNKDKKVAIICYNYPPGEANLFGGAFLDTFESVSAILCRLKDEGYTTKNLSAQELMKDFTAGKAVNWGKYDCNWDEKITYPSSRYKPSEEVEEAWGKSPGNIMVDEGEFFIPGIIVGNVFIGLQPTRSVYEDDEVKSYHDRTLPPHHQYIAFYEWLASEFNSDVVVHVGTHGTLEFLKGKETALSGECYPDKLIKNMPHIYLYYCANPAEAVVAKRRAYANIVSYQPPVFVKSELYGKWLELGTEIENYSYSLSVSENSSKDILTLIEKLASELGLPSDLDEIEDELYRMQNSLIPKGLHIFGKAYDKEELELYRQAIMSIKSEEEQKDKKILSEVNEHVLMAGENHELDGLIRALNGEYNPPKLAGDILRSPDVLPSGYNLYQFDSRLVPTRTAMMRGKRICDNTLATYYKENNEYPKSVAVIMWGIETSRTQGETLAQMLSYLGVRLSSKSTAWDQQFEIIPIEELGRPRIDVTANICGFFRDMFANIIEKVDDILNQIYELDETDGQNYFKANSKVIYNSLIESEHSEKDARQLAVTRIFGPKEGEYGTKLTSVIGSKDWQEESELGFAFTAELRFAYNRRMSGRNVKGLYEKNLKAVDIVSQIRNSTEYEITDLDHYYEFFGGLSKSVEIVKGKKAKMIITDTTTDKIVSENVEKAISRGINTRVLNPKWIEGMLSHNHHGAQHVSKRFENLMGLAATTGEVEEKLYDKLMQTYVEDESISSKMKENNPFAYMEILEQMMEYSNRGYWKATEEQIAKIKETYLAVENSLEEKL